FAVSGGVPQAQGIFAVVADANIEDVPTIAMSATGRFDIAYERQFSGADWDIFASQYDGTGALVHGFIFVNFDSNPEHNPSIAMDNADNAIVAYQEFFGVHSTIVANRLGRDGSVGRNIQVAIFDAFSGIDALNPSVALAPLGGRFVVAYDTVLRSGTSVGVRADEVAPDDTVRFFGAPPSVGPFDGVSSAVSIDGFGRYIVTYERRNPSTNHLDIFSRR